MSGVPAANAHIAFRPIDEAAGSVLSVGRTGPDGSFRLTTFSTDDGAPAGEYVVTVVWPNDSIPRDECADPATHDRLNGYYADPTPRRLVVIVRPGPNRIDLKLTVGSVGWTLPRARPEVSTKESPRAIN